MRLLYVTDALAIHGGIERVLTDKLNWLVEHGGCDISLLLASQGNHPIVYPLNSQVECHNLGIMFHKAYSFRGLQRYRLMYQYHRLFRQRLEEQIRKYCPDIIVLIRIEFIVDVMSVRRAIPVVFESHNSCLFYKYEKHGFFRKLKIKYWYHTLSNVQMIVALTQGDALEWKKINPQVRVIPNVVHLNDTGRYSGCYAKSAIFVGRYSYQKDIPSLLRIWECVCRRFPDWHLHIWGGYGEQKEELQKAIKLAKINIIIHESTSLIYDEYLKSSLLLMTSRFEPFGLVLPEAMSCGLPVVAFDCPDGPSEIITDGVNGYLISAGDIDGFVEKVCLLIDNADLRLKLSRAGILSSQKYADSNIMPIWLKLFNNLLQ